MGPSLHGKHNSGWRSQARRRLAVLLQVAAGGLLGAGVREAMSQAWPTSPDGFPIVTLLVNLSGSLLIGCLLVVLFRVGDDTGRRHRWRLTAATGFLGAYTTYSTFAVQTDLLVRSGHSSRAILYVVATIAGGLAATVVGMVLGVLGSGWRQPALPVDPEADQIVAEP